MNKNWYVTDKISESGIVYCVAKEDTRGLNNLFTREEVLKEVIRVNRRELEHYQARAKRAEEIASFLGDLLKVQEAEAK